MKILVTDKIVDEGIDILKGKGYEVDERSGLSPNELLECVGAYDALIVRSATQVTREVIEAATNCKIIGRAGVTCDNIDVDACDMAFRMQRSTRQYRFGSRAHYGAHAFGGSKFPPPMLRLHAGKFSRDRFMGLNSMKDACHFGLRRIGGLVANAPTRSACALWASTRIARRLAQSQLGVALFDSMDEVLPIADFITVHVPRTDGVLYVCS